jgi:polar amino acid transport system substrate-binding protein
VGDKVLRAISKAVSASIRESDELGRWGGEEFIVVCPETSMENALSLAEKIRKNIEEIVFVELNGVTCSLGVAQYDDKQSYENLIYCADMALYKAKNSGKNRVVASKNEA